MRNILILFLTVLLCFQTACTQTNIVDSQRIIHVAGFDITKDKKFQGAILYPDYTLGVKTKPKTQSTTARSLETIASHLNAKSPHNVVLGQMRVVLFGKSIGSHGIDEIINNLQRDPNIGRDVQLALVDGSVEELLKYVTPNGSLYLSDLLEQNIMNENIPRTALNIFLYDYYSFVCDPFLPYIQIADNHSVSVKGLAFLKEDKVVMYTDKKDSFLVKLLLNPTKNGRYETQIKKDNHKGLVVTQNLSGKSVHYVDQTGATPKVTIRLKLNGLIKNAPSWIDLSKKENIRSVKNQVEQNIKNQSQKLIQQFQQKKIDPLGIRDQIRSRSRKWTIQQIQAMYPSIDINVEADVNVVQSGIGE
ncbi:MULTISPECIES: Ger(x)C family spore germination protein [Bacillus cereus group]|uniref:Ger(X)C family spore germination protein n=1 Tax=Bacillus cereus TaxID=1396 RepID=A0AA44Q7S1_BACCE|nr:MULTISPECIES: Ger(x)C family spore germination protein [Bacillus cereus group]PFN08562.1 Ger(x)C family spore germination protein [Bacillus cereus]PFO77914.1 Ger(x)C family spore germination protein [Bacillus cereus]PFR27105.1 Ger(x)C family spore germination protein [Bacillus cereus]PFR97242.1 Ger(x)C family spore germination protein [Bacillus cereus]PGZ14909.1 Ger(x)C family spore germination protein [Bacillus cereus]